MRPGAPEDGARRAAARAVREALRGRVPVEDPEFDQLYPDHVRRLSLVHWTPVPVAQRAAALLAPEAGMSVLDIGAGPGKLCCVGALACGGTWHGVEQHPSLVAAAAELATWLEVDHGTRFHAGDMRELDWRRFDSLYFYNPFETPLFGDGGSDAAAWAVFVEQVACAEARLSELAPGTRVVTFHGFGGEMPSSFTRAFAGTIGGGELALWIQRPRARPGRPAGSAPGRTDQA